MRFRKYYKKRLCLLLDYFVQMLVGILFEQKIGGIDGWTFSRTHDKRELFFVSSFLFFSFSSLNMVSIVIGSIAWRHLGIKHGAWYFYCIGGVFMAGLEDVS